jgi:hypothetical protein
MPPRPYQTNKKKTTFSKSFEPSKAPTPNLASSFLLSKSCHWFQQRFVNFNQTKGFDS